MAHLDFVMFRVKVVLDPKNYHKSWRGTMNAFIVTRTARRHFLSTNNNKPLLKYLALALALGAAPGANAVDRWFDCTSGSLLTASCWSANTLPTAADTAYIGYTSYAQNVTATLASGTLNVDLEYIGHSTRNGTVTQTGGAHIVDKNLYLGFNTGITGTYNLQGGTLTTNNDGSTYFQTVGYQGTGNFSHSGGTHSSGPLYLGYLAGSAGNYSLSGTASLNAKQYLQVGASGTGVFTQTGGTNSVDLAGVISSLFLGAGSTGHGTYNLSAGSLAAGTAIVGNSGTGIFNQSGGMHTLSGSIFDGSLVVGGNSGSNGTYNLSGTGNLIANSGTIGQSGTGTFTQTSGTHTVTSTLAIAQNVGSYGTYNLQGGLLKANTIDIVNAGTAAFNFTGGTLAVGQFTGNLVNNGGTLAPGNSPGTTNITGNYTQSAAGIFAVEIGGLLAGTEYDVLNVSGTTSLDGTLNVSLFDLGSGLFAPQAGDSFDILTAEILSGSFSSLSYAALLDPNLSWQIDYLTDAIGTTDVVRLSVVSAVPVPGAVWLFGSGLLGLMSLVRRKNR